MPEYIKREAVLEWFKPYTHEDITLEPVDVIADIRAIPAADVVEVVRCRECIFKQKPKQFGDLQCKILDVPMRNDDFCSYGERKEDVNA